MNKELLRQIIREEVEKIKEAVALSRVKPLMKLNRANKHRDEFFKKLAKLPSATFSKRKDRIYFPIGKSKVAMGRLEKEIVDTLANYDYKVIDYLKNIAETPKGQRIKMTKALSRVGEDDLLNFYSRQSKAKIRDVASGKLICFSKHPYDLKGMSLGRSWEGGSCMATSMGNSYIPLDIEKGTIVVYSIEPDDLNLSNPKGRVLLKQFINVYDSYDVKYFAEQNSYGEISPQIMTFISNIGRKVQNIGVGEYRLDCKLYNDSNVERVISDVDLGNLYDSDLGELYSNNFKNIGRSDDGNVWVRGDMDITSKGITEFPYNVHTVMGGLYMNDNKITHLKWFPKIIERFLVLTNNRIKNWKFAPNRVGSLIVKNNPLDTLVGSPLIVGIINSGMINISSTNIKNFEGMRVKASNINVFCNDMKSGFSLKKLPTNVEYVTLSHSGVAMKNLEGMPKRIEKYFECKVESVEGIDKCEYIKNGEITYLPTSEGDIQLLIRELHRLEFGRLVIKVPSQYEAMVRRGTDDVKAVRSVRLYVTTI
jgi:hypothetical protein